MGCATIRSWEVAPILFTYEGPQVTTKEALEKGKKEGVAFIKADLFKAELSQLRASFINLRSANLSYANLRSANIESANLCSTNLEGTDFEDANLNHVHFAGANILNTNFKGADLSFAFFSNTDLTKANFKNADLTQADLLNAVIDHKSITRRMPRNYKEMVNYCIKFKKKRIVGYLTTTNNMHTTHETHSIQLECQKEFETQGLTLDDPRRIHGNFFHVRTPEFIWKSTVQNWTHEYNHFAKLLEVSFSLKDMLRIPYNTNKLLKVRKLYVVRTLGKSDLRQIVEA